MPWPTAIVGDAGEPVEFEAAEIEGAAGTEDVV
jgi:hypothetical protein